MSGKPQYTDDEILAQFRANLDALGHHVSGNQYDTAGCKPTRCTLARRLGGRWKDWLAKIGIEPPAPVIPEAPADLPAHFDELTRQNQSLLRDIEKLRNRNQLFIETCLPAIDRCSFRASPIPKPERIKRDQGFHSMQGDFHIGERVDPAWVQGVAECNMDILLNQRLPRLCERIITFREQDKAALGLNKLVVHLLGDIVTGELIFKGQAYHIDATLIDQLLRGTEAYVSFLLALAAHFPTMLVQHGDFVFALNHNDNVKGWAGIPYYGLDRKARRMDGLYGMQIHYKLGGHFHSPAELNDETLLNGTMIGGTDLSVNKMMVATRPSQKIFYLDDKHGIHRTTNLYLADRVTLTPDANGIFTAYST